MRVRPIVGLTFLLLSASAAIPAQAAGLASCSVNVTPVTSGLTIRFLGSGNIPQGEFSTNAWVAVLTGARSNGSTINQTIPSFARYIDETLTVDTSGSAYGQLRAELTFAGSTQYIACYAANDVAWTPSGITILPY